MKGYTVMRLRQKKTNSSFVDTPLKASQHVLESNSKITTSKIHSDIPCNTGTEVDMPCTPTLTPVNQDRNDSPNTFEIPNAFQASKNDDTIASDVHKVSQYESGIQTPTAILVSLTAEDQDSDSSSSTCKESNIPSNILYKALGSDTSFVKGKYFSCKLQDTYTYTLTKYDYEYLQ